MSRGSLITFTAEAHASIDEIRRGRPWAPQKTDDLMDALWRKFRQLSEWPESCRRWHGGQFLAAVKGHCVVYEYDAASNVVLVVDVVDGRADAVLMRLAR